jgi:hypothetical protein
MANYKGYQSIVGSVVECSPATRAARVRFPDDAIIFELLRQQRIDELIIPQTTGT